MGGRGGKISGRLPKKRTVRGGFNDKDIPAALTFDKVLKAAGLWITDKGKALLVKDITKGGNHPEVLEKHGYTMEQAVERGFISYRRFRGEAEFGLFRPIMQRSVKIMERLLDRNPEIKHAVITSNYRGVEQSTEITRKEFDEAGSLEKALRRKKVRIW